GDGSLRRPHDRRPRPPARFEPLVVTDRYALDVGEIVVGPRNDHARKLLGARRSGTAPFSQRGGHRDDDERGDGQENDGPAGGGVPVVGADRPAERGEETDDGGDEAGRSEAAGDELSRGHRD